MKLYDAPASGLFPLPPSKKMKHAIYDAIHREQSEDQKHSIILPCL